MASQLNGSTLSSFIIIIIIIIVYHYYYHLLLLSFIINICCYYYYYYYFFFFFSECPHITLLVNLLMSSVKFINISKRFQLHFLNICNWKCILLCSLLFTLGAGWWSLNVGCSFSSVIPFSLYNLIINSYFFSYSFHLVRYSCRDIQLLKETFDFFRSRLHFYFFFDELLDVWLISWSVLHFMNFLF